MLIVVPSSGDPSLNPVLLVVPVGVLVVLLSVVVILCCFRDNICKNFEQQHPVQTQSFASVVRLVEDMWYCERSVCMYVCVCVCVCEREREREIMMVA